MFNEAINILKEYIERYPSSERATAARELLVAAYYNSRDYDAAYEAIKSDPAAMNDSDMRTALQKIAYFRGLEAFDRGDLDRAESCMKESAEVGVSPKYTALSSFWRGEIAYSRGDRERAVRCYEAYLRRAPRTEREYALAQYNLGYCLFDGRDMEHARDRSRHSLRHIPHATTTITMRRTVWAMRNTRCATPRGPRHLTARWPSRSRATVTMPSGRRLSYTAYRGKTQDKITALRAIVEADRGDYVDDAWYELGRTYLTQERYADGVKTLEAFVEAYDRSPYYLQALSDLGLAYFNLGDKSRSKEYYRRVVDEAPQSSEAAESMRGIREIYVAEGNVDEYFAYAEGRGMGGDVERRGARLAELRRGQRRLPRRRRFIGRETRLLSEKLSVGSQYRRCAVLSERLLREVGRAGARRGDHVASCRPRPFAVQPARAGRVGAYGIRGRACTTVRRSRIWRCTRCCRRAIRAVRLCRDMRVR